MDSLRSALKLIHKAGVIHVDLYASNVMWMPEVDSRRLSIKIVDWDASHCLEEGDFSAKIKSLLKMRIYSGESCNFGVEHDLLYLRVYEMDVKVEDAWAWEDLASGVKGIIDTAYQHLFREMLKSGKR